MTSSLICLYSTGNSIFLLLRVLLEVFLDIFPVRIHTHPQEPIVSIARNIERYVRTMLKYPISSIELSRRIAEQEGLKQGSLSPIIFSNSINMLPKGISHSTKNFSIDPPKVQTGAPGTYIDLVLYTWEDKWCLDWNYLMELFDQQYIIASIPTIYQNGLSTC